MKKFDVFLIFILGGLVALFLVYVCPTPENTHLIEVSEVVKSTWMKPDVIFYQGKALHYCGNPDCRDCFMNYLRLVKTNRKKDTQ